MDRTAEGKGGKLLRTALCTAALISVFVMTAASERVSAGVTSAMKLCVKSLIPAIFPFLVLNGILVRCGFPEKAGKIIGAPVSFLFGIDRSLAAAVVTGFLCGFPAGAAAADGIFASGLCRKEDVGRASLCSSFASPGFMIAGVGVSMLGSARAGIALWLFQAAAVICAGITVNLVSPVKLSGNGYTGIKVTVSPLSAVSAAVKESAESMLGICGSVIFFSVFSGFALSLGSLPAAVRCVIACFFEMTSGTEAAAEMLPPDIAFVAAAWAAGWSGVSVHAQTSLVTGGKTGGRYVAGKALTSLLSALFAAAALKTGLI